MEFNQRLAAGTEGQDSIRAALECLHFIVTPFGQEKWLNPTIHNVIAGICQMVLIRLFF